MLRIRNDIQVSTVTARGDDIVLITKNGLREERGGSIDQK
jgi:hypothetical protein